MRWLADLIYFIGAMLYLPVALYNALVVGKNRSGWGQRFGFVPRFDPNRRRIWIHAVSLGEVNATPRLIEALTERLPDVEVVVSTTTDTGYARASQLFNPDHVFRFPLDFSLIVTRVLRRVRPAMIVLVELEVWYNLVRMATRRGIPVAVVNGRLTPQSTRRLGRLGRPVHTMFRDLAWVGAQDETIASRFRVLGVLPDRIEVTSSLKWDSASLADRVDGADLLARAVGIDGSRPVWVCGSTGPGEEAVILDAYRRLVSDWPQSLPDSPLKQGNDRPPPLLAVVPRKPERFDEVARLIEQVGFTCVRRSRCPDGASVEAGDETAVVLGDTMGELRKFYSLADVVFVGRTLVPLGGSDPMEVAAMARPVVVGPHTDNFELPVEALRAADAIRIVRSGDALPSVVGAILRDRSLAQRLGATARQVVISNQGATTRTADAIVRVLNPARAGGAPEPARGNRV